MAKNTDEEIATLSRQIIFREDHGPILTLVRTLKKIRKRSVAIFNYSALILTGCIFISPLIGLLAAYGFSYFSVVGWGQILSPMSFLLGGFILGLAGKKMKQFFPVVLRWTEIELNPQGLHFFRTTRKERALIRAYKWTEIDEIRMFRYIITIQNRHYTSIVGYTLVFRVKLVDGHTVHSGDIFSSRWPQVLYHVMKTIVSRADEVFSQLDLSIPIKYDKKIYSLL